jgi:spore photoproduct lyase
MKFELDEVLIEDGIRASSLAQRVLSRIPGTVNVCHVADGRPNLRPFADAPDPFAAGKRRMVVMRRRSSFLMACPAAASGFACCGYLVAVLASNCPMDCSYCFLQEFLADNPSFQVYANYSDCFAELERLSHQSPNRVFRVGTGELADSLAFDSLTGMASDLVEFFAQQSNLTLELKTKTDEIGGLLDTDPRGRTIVSWTLSTEAVYRSSEHRTASPARRIDSAARVLDAGYRVAFHLDPIVAYPGAERDYDDLIDALAEAIPAHRIAFVSLGGLRMPPALRQRARARFPNDVMLTGEDVLAPDGRYRTFMPLRMAIYRRLKERLARMGVESIYLCMEQPSVYERIFGASAPSPGSLGAILAGERH